MNLKTIITTLTIFCSIIITKAQTAFQNEGVVKMHAGAKVGFHTNLVNNGKFDENKGFTGFYHESNVLTVSGDNKTVFNNVEIGVVNNLELQTSLGVTNKLSFLEGKVVTPRNEIGVSLDFMNHNFYIGEGNTRHVDGYASVIGSKDFNFPIGDDGRLRPMILSSQVSTTLFKGAYFFENPNTPSTFSINFETSKRDTSLKNISNFEFWDLNGTTETSITLTWDGQSNIVAIANTIEELRVVGWNKTTKIWENLGNTNITGNLDSGTISSIPFIPNTYEIITIGSVNGKKKNNNYLISPDKDNINDNLIIEGTEEFKHNLLSIYNRWGILVFRAKNYKGEFKGQSNGRSTIFAEDGLPTGTYFYIIEYGNTPKLGKQQKGWVYVK